MDKHKLAGIIGIVVLALGVILILPFVKEGSFVGKAVEVPTNQVHHLPFDEITADGEINKAENVVAPDYNGTVKGTNQQLQVVEGIVGSGFRFSGGDAYVYLSSNVFFTKFNDKDVTFSVWVNPDEFSEERRIASSMENKGWRIARLNGNLLLEINWETLPSSVTNLKEIDLGDLPAGEWSHIAVVHDEVSGSEDDVIIKVYLNGEKVYPLSGDGRINGIVAIGDNGGRPLLIGGEPSSAGLDSRYTFKGVIDEVSFFDVPLTSDQIKALYRSAVGFTFNRYAEEGDVLGSFTSAENDYKKTFDALTALGVTAVTSLGTTVDLQTNAASFQTYLGAGGNGVGSINVDNPESAPEVAYFRYGGNSYVVELYKYDSQQGVVELKVRDLGLGTIVGSTIRMEITEDDPLHFTPKNTPLNLLGGSEAEVFLKTFAFYNSAGKLGLIVVASPNTDLNSLASGKTVLYSGMNEQFLFSDGTYQPVVFVQSGTDYIIQVGTGSLAKQYNSGVITVDSDSDGLFEFTHYLDREGTTGVNFEVKFSSEGWLYVDMEKFPAGLDDIYEKFMTREKVIRFNSLNLKVCPIGSGNNYDVADWRLVKVCDDSGYKFSLLADEAKSAKDLGLVTVEGDATTGAPIADSQAVFWFPDQEGVKDDKEVYVFKYRNVTDKSVLEEGSTFSNNLVKGRRMAFLLEDEAEGKQYYLLSHDSTGLLNFNNLKVIAMHKPELYSPLPDSDRERALFNLPVEAFRAESKQLNIQRLINESSATYNISGVTAVLRSVNLNKELQTGISTYGSVDVQGLGLVRLSTSDVVTTSRTMDIRVGPKNDLTSSFPYQLDLEVAQAIPKDGDAVNTGAQKYLFHYETFREETARGADNPHTKVADIFLLYDLGAPSDVNPNGLTAQHTFSDMDFTVPILKGKQLALHWEGKYYLLGYNEGLQWSETVRENPRGFFEEGKLELRTLGQRGKLRARYVPEEKTAYFDLPSGDKIKVTFDDTIGSKLVRFSAVNFIPSAITDFNPETEFEANLPEQSQTEVFNQLRVLNAAGTTAGLFRNCDNRDYSNRPGEMILCSQDQTFANGDILTKFNPGEDLFTYTGTVSGAKVLVTLKNRLSQYNKEVSFQYLLPAANLVQNLGWLDFTDLLLAGKSPAIKLNSGYFEITGTDQFGSLKLVNISQTAEQYPIVHYQQGVKDNEGLVAINENLFGFKQFEDASRTDRLRIEFEQFKLVNTNGLSLGADDEVDFITRIDADVQENIYALTLSTADAYVDVNGPSEVNVLIEEVAYTYPLAGQATRGSPGRVFFQGDVPLSVEKVILLQNGDKIKVSPAYQKDQAGNLVTNAAGEVQLIVKVVKLP
ncbi:MAG TPA: LamG domain-containing protein [Candidatus Nanoarchaeia archaeon]|nr:LamG domain-containing protein [Candidatus Nanoarchaeia archaeon]